MFKRVSQQGRSEREAKAYFVCYVEALSDARTQRGMRFNILVGRRNKSL